MRRFIPWRLAALSLMAVCVVTAIAWNRSQARAAIAPAATLAAATTQFAGFGGGEETDEAVTDAPKVYVRIPYSPEAASTLEKLHTKVNMPFSQETPLGDVIKYLDGQLNPTDENGNLLNDDTPLQFYINPRGLEEADKTIDSPTTLDLKQIPASTALELCLDNLNLEYRVRPDGIVEIDAKGSDRADQQEPVLLLLNEVRQLRAEVARMKMQQGGMMGGMGQASAATGGGFR
jgi:hypothetical protein